MTIGDYIKGKLELWSVEVSDEAISLDLSGVGLDSEAGMTAEVNTDKFFYRVIPDFLLMPSSISEGGFSVGRSKEAMEAYYRVICQRSGLPNALSSNKIKDITAKWV